MALPVSFMSLANCWALFLGLAVDPAASKPRLHSSESEVLLPTQEWHLHGVPRSHRTW